MFPHPFHPHRAIWYGPDAEGVNGIYLGLNVVTEATRALTMAMTKVAPWVLTWRQLGEAAANWVQKAVLKAKVPAYRPCFAEGLQHFLLHAGG